MLEWQRRKLAQRGWNRFAVWPVLRLPKEQANYIDHLVSSGTYATTSEVVRAGLRALRERDAAVERWLRDEVVPVATAMQMDPERALSADQVFDEIRDLHTQRSETANGAS